MTDSSPPGYKPWYNYFQNQLETKTFLITAEFRDFSGVKYISEIKLLNLSILASYALTLGFFVVYLGYLLKQSTSESTVESSDLSLSNDAYTCTLLSVITKESRKTIYESYSYHQYRLSNQECLEQLLMTKPCESTRSSIKMSPNTNDGYLINYSKYAYKSSKIYLHIRHSLTTDGSDFAPGPYVYEKNTGNMSRLSIISDSYYYKISDSMPVIDSSGVGYFPIDSGASTGSSPGLYNSETGSAFRLSGAINAIFINDNLMNIYAFQENGGGTSVSTVDFLGSSLVLTPVYTLQSPFYDYYGTSDTVFISNSGVRWIYKYLNYGILNVFKDGILDAEINGFVGSSLTVDVLGKYLYFVAGGSIKRLQLPLMSSSTTDQAFSCCNGLYQAFTIIDSWIIFERPLSAQCSDGRDCYPLTIYDIGTNETTVLPTAASYSIYWSICNTTVFSNSTASISSMCDSNGLTWKYDTVGVSDYTILSLPEIMNETMKRTLVETCNQELYNQICALTKDYPPYLCTKTVYQSLANSISNSASLSMVCLSMLLWFSRLLLSNTTGKGRTEVKDLQIESGTADVQFNALELRQRAVLNAKK